MLHFPIRMGVHAFTRARGQYGLELWLLRDGDRNRRPNHFAMENTPQDHISKHNSRHRPHPDCITNFPQFTSPPDAAIQHAQPKDSNFNNPANKPFTRRAIYSTRNSQTEEAGATL